MKYEVKKKCLDNIVTFYRNVSRKYKHTYSKELMFKNMEDAYDSMFLIEKSPLRREPTIARWQKEWWYMAHAGKWYYAYTLTDDTITIEDACHEQNMHEGEH